MAEPHEAYDGRPALLRGISDWLKDRGEEEWGLELARAAIELEESRRYAADVGIARGWRHKIELAIDRAEHPPGRRVTVGDVMRLVGAPPLVPTPIPDDEMPYGTGYRDGRPPTAIVPGGRGYYRCADCGGWLEGTPDTETCARCGRDLRS